MQVIAATTMASLMAWLMLDLRPAAAAETFGRSFEYGVFVNGRRIQVGNAIIPVRAGQAVRIQGWVVDADSGKPGLSLLCAVDGGAPAPVSAYPLPRPDVATAQHDSGADKSGFELPIDLSKLSTGVHRYHFILVGQNSASTPLTPDVQLSASR